MTRPEIESALAAAIDAESTASGFSWWPGKEMAPIAFRRWSSFERRHPKQKNPTLEDRVHDLDKGLRSHFEPDVPYTPLFQWLDLARVMAEVLKGHNV